MADRVQLLRQIVYVESELPPGMTIAEYRATRTAPPKRRRKSSAWLKRFRRR